MSEYVILGFCLLIVWLINRQEIDYTTYATVTDCSTNNNILHYITYSFLDKAGREQQKNIHQLYRHKNNEKVKVYILKNGKIKDSFTQHWVIIMSAIMFSLGVLQNYVI